MTDSTKAEKKAAVQRLKQARADLADLAERDIKKYGRGKAPETDEYLRRNKAVVDAEKVVPWWRR